MEPSKRYIGSGYELIHDNKLFQVYKLKDYLIAKLYVGKRKDPAWHYKFRTEEELKKKIDETAGNLLSWEKMKAERKQKRSSAIDSVEVGQIYSCSWGYEQTNIDFYQVTEKNGKEFTMREIGSRLEYGEGLSPMAGYVYAKKDAFIADKEPIKKRSLSMDFGILSLTTEQEKHYCSWYA